MVPFWKETPSTINTRNCPQRIRSWTNKLTELCWRSWRQNGWTGNCRGNWITIGWWTRRLVNYWTGGNRWRKLWLAPTKGCGLQDSRLSISGEQPVDIFLIEYKDEVMGLKWLVSFFRGKRYDIKCSLVSYLHIFFEVTFDSVYLLLFHHSGIHPKLQFVVVFPDFDPNAVHGIDVGVLRADHTKDAVLP